MSKSVRQPQDRLSLSCGWRVIAAAVVGQSFSLGTLIVYTFGVFEEPLAHEFKSGRGSIALAVSLLDLTVTFAAPWTGRFVDRYSARKAIMASLVALSGCLLCCGPGFIRRCGIFMYSIYLLGW